MPPSPSRTRKKITWARSRPTASRDGRKGGEAVILQPRYDLYLQPLDGGQATNLTRGVGAEREIRFRILDLEPDEDEIDLDEPLYHHGLRPVDEEGRLLSAGRESVRGPGHGRRPVRAAAESRFRRRRPFHQEDFETFPDYYTSGLDFSNPVQVTDANPQQSEFNWGRRILFDYETHDGVRLQGILAIPYDYVEGEKRPMLVKFYEKNSQNLHSYPAPGYRSSPNFAEYVSAGYLVMQPDIHFRTGPSHGRCWSVSTWPWTRSWRWGTWIRTGSGSTATPTAARAPPTSPPIRTGSLPSWPGPPHRTWSATSTSSGRAPGPNQHGYDTYGQGRFGTNPYDDLELFLDQSAAQNADQMNTPPPHPSRDRRRIGGVAPGRGVLQRTPVERGRTSSSSPTPGRATALGSTKTRGTSRSGCGSSTTTGFVDKPAPKWMESGRTFLQKGRDLDMMKRGGSGGGG